jgi:hypothetical protein
MARDALRDIDAFQAVLEGTVEKAPRAVIDLAKLAVALEPASRPGPDPKFAARLRKELVAQATAAEVADETAFAAMLEGDKTIVLDELVPLAKLANAMAASAVRAEPSAAFRFQLRNKLTAGAGRAATPARGRAAAFADRLNERMKRSLRAVGATGLAATMMLSGGAALAASHNANPGDLLYGVKRFHERAQLSVTSGVPRGTRLLSFARTRLGEVKHLADHEVRATPLYVGALNDMDAETVEGTSILIDEFRSHGTRAALQSVKDFARSQQAGLASVIGRIPAGARPAAQDSLNVAQRVENRVDLVLRGCPCPSNALVQPAVPRASGAQPAAVQCGCGQTSDGGGANDGSGSTQPTPTGGSNNPDTHDPNPQPTPGILDPIPDVPGTPIDNQIKESLDPLLPTPTPGATLPTALPSAVDTPAIPTAEPSLAPTGLPTLPLSAPALPFQSAVPSFL